VVSGVKMVTASPGLRASMAALYESGSLVSFAGYESNEVSRLL
jgi:hypothetical protein